VALACYNEDTTLEESKEVLRTQFVASAFVPPKEMSIESLSMIGHLPSYLYHLPSTEPMAEKWYWLMGQVEYQELTYLDEDISSVPSS